MKTFMRLVKIDEEKRLITARATQEIADKSSEILDYESAKPEFAKWSSEIEKASKGKSKGNIREMHGNKVAGRVEQIFYNDAEKAIDMEIYVIADDAWKMCKEGGYTGLSIGGSYIRKWKDADNPDLTRFTPRIVETSLVDNPCVPTATFTAVKSDGTVEMRKFKTREEAQEDMEPKQVWQASDGSNHDTKAAAEAHNEVLKAMGKLQPAADAIDKAAAALKGETEEEKAAREKKEAEEKKKKEEDAAAKKKDYSTEEREKMAQSGEAMSGGEYPIKTKDDLHNAIQSFGRAKDKAKTKAHIKARAKALGAEDMLPSKWKDSDSKKAARGKLKKDMASVARTAELLAGLEWLHLMICSEEMREGDDSDGGSHIAEIIEEMCDFLESHVEEECAELKEGHMEMAASIPADFAGALVKFVKHAGVKEALEKAGARHSRGDMEHLTKMSGHLHKMQEQHDAASEHLADMHKCMKGLGMEGHEAEEEGDANQKMAKLVAQNAAMESLLQKAVSAVEKLPETLAQKDGVIKNLSDRLSAVENTPLPRKSSASYTIEKGHEPAGQAAETTGVVIFKAE